MKVVINKCFGGFSLSPKCLKRWMELKGKTAYFYIESNGKLTPIDVDAIPKISWDWLAFLQDGFTDSKTAFNSGSYIHNRPDDRADPDLIKAVEELGKEANGARAELEIVDIPEDLKYYIDDYDGRESIHEEHRSWY